MRRRTLALTLVAISLMMIHAGQPAGAQEDAPPLMLPDQVRALVDGGEYHEALAALTRIVAAHGEVVAGYDRLEMLMLRAECQLQVHENRAALDSAAMVVKEAVARDRPKDAAKAIAFSELIAKSPGMVYKPKARRGATQPAPIKVLDRKMRQQAYQALFDDEFADAKKKVDATAGVRTMPPILEAGKAVGTVRALEIAATNDSAQTKDLAATLASEGLPLMKAALNEMSPTIDTMAVLAAEMVVVPTPQYDSNSGRAWVDRTPRHRGLTGPEAQNMKGIEQTCAQIISAASEMSLELGDDDHAFHDLGQHAGDMDKKAMAILKGDYDQLGK